VTFVVRRATPLCGLSITLVVARHLYGEGGSFSRCKVSISPRQHFVYVDTVLGEVSEWIVGNSSRADCRRPPTAMGEWRIIPPARSELVELSREL
jgi:hypothetical protein